MHTNVNLAAPVGALLLLGIGFLLLVTTAVLLQSFAVRKPRRTKFVLITMAALAASYLGAMLLFSFTSHETVLARGEEKHFCELDCHLAYSIVATRQAKLFGEQSQQTTAHGQFTVVTIKTRFDEDTISPRRGNASLTPNERALTMLDDRGNRYLPAGQSGTPLSTSLRPGETYTTEVAFDLPVEVKAVALLINERDFLTHLVIGHENSLLHHQARFQL
jgi:hypothetical protein